MQKKNQKGKRRRKERCQFIQIVNLAVLTASAAQQNQQFIRMILYNIRYIFKGAGGVPWVQIMENEFECLVVRWGDGGHFAEKFVKKYCS